VARYTRSDGRDEIQSTLKSLQQDWERLVRKMANTKVALETSLLQWADYSSSCNNLKKWISEKEAKLQQVCEQKVSMGRKSNPGSGMRTLSLGARQATLRRTSSFVQDIVSFEPMIESVTSKADDLLHRSPTTAEISNKYQSLSRQAHEIYAKQKQVMDVHQSFIDAGNEFMHWLRAAKEMVNKLSEPTGDRESLSSKVTHVNTKLMTDKAEGQQKLEAALEKAEAACKASDEEDRDIVEEEVAFLQEEFDNYCEALAKLKESLESG
jgi:nesprin-1